jgi:hypothetical protein
MPRTRPEVCACLDEIEAAQASLLKSPADGGRVLRGWIRRQKAILKEFGYTGKISRRTRCSKKIRSSKASVRKK